MNERTTRPQPPLPGENWRRQIQLADLEETAEFARRLAAQLRPGDLLVLTGGLGAGKTTFTQALGAALGVQEPISSPTFVLSRIHRNIDEAAADLVHVDAYRTDEEGIESLDLLATAPQSVTVVEWGRGLVERVLAGPDGSWLDLELKPRGSQPAAAGPAFTPAGPGGGETPTAIQTDFSESEEDLLGSPRSAVLRGYGARWADPLRDQ